MDPERRRSPGRLRRKLPAQGVVLEALCSLFLAQKLRGANSKRNRYALVSPGSAETLLRPPALRQDLTKEGSLVRAVQARGTSRRRKGGGDQGEQRTEGGEAVGGRGDWAGRAWGPGVGSGVGESPESGVFLRHAEEGPWGWEKVKAGLV